jgi:enoyl-CoA hydratase/carnithine racemase
MSQFIKISKEDSIAILTIDRPPVNALNIEAMSELDQAVEEMQKDAQVKVIIITGAGSMAFVAGADVNIIGQIKSAQEGEALALQGQKILNRIENSSKVVIAAINSMCLGGGNELIMACHLRVASDRARFGQPEINLGIIPGFGGTQRLARLCGTSRAMELVLTGDVITAQEAHRIGLVNRVVPEAELLRQTLHLAKKIASKGQVAVRLAVKAINEGVNVPLQAGLQLEAKLFSQTCETLDRSEGVKAFLEKRQPKFQDR